MKNKILFIFVALIFLSCELIPDLKHDNPNDNKSVDYKGNNTDEKNIEISISSVESYYTNYNGIQSGENVRFEVYIQNTGAVKASKIRGVITSDSDLIENLNPLSNEIEFLTLFQNDLIDPNNIALGYYDGQDYSLEFKIKDNVSSGSNILFNLSLKDINNNKWLETFNIKIE